jgi:hypothetical protein
VQESRSSIRTFSNENLLTGQAIDERLDQVARGKVENDTKNDGDRESRECFSVHGQEEKGQAQTLKR